MTDATEEQKGILVVKQRLTLLQRVYSVTHETLDSYEMVPRPPIRHFDKRQERVLRVFILLAAFARISFAKNRRLIGISANVAGHGPLGSSD